MSKINIAIDGPAGAGKSTIAKLLAKELSYTYIDTGAMYRALTYLLIKKDLPLTDENLVLETLRNDYDFSFEGEKIILNGEDITNLIRSNEINANVSTIVAYKKMRELMVEKQRELSNKKGVVMDGRDIGSVVLKDAELKIFLVASLEERARRRFLENKEKGIETTYEEVEENLKKRDYIDTYVSKALVKTKDAIEVDTTNMSIKEVVARIKDLATTRNR
ncbi:TPA: (d)CMP kinase [bacterium]|nr:(d)CMP kinase [bacterium]